MHIVENFESFVVPDVDDSVLESKRPDNKVTVIAEAIHAGMTKNFTFYSAEKLSRSVDSWVTPYNKPVLKNHDLNTDPLGRVVAAEFKKSVVAPEKDCIQLKMEITDPEAIEKIKDGRYLTLSIGGTAKSAVCSICGVDVVKEGFCGHIRGKTYEGRQAYWIVGEVEFEEVSFVNVPADSNAMVISNSAAEDVADETNPIDDADVAEKELGKDGKPINKMQVDTPGRTNFAHRLLHMWWKNPEKTNWTREQIKKEHARVVRAMFRHGMNHNIVDGLDETLPEDLKKRSKRKGNESAEERRQMLVEHQTEELIDELLKNGSEKIETVEEKNTEPEVVVEKEEEVEDKLTEMTAELESLKAQLAEKDQKIAELEEQLEAANKEVEAYLKQNVELAKFMHSQLIETVIDLKVALEEAEEADREKLREELSSLKTAELKEMVKELATKKLPRVIQTVEVSPSDESGEEVVEEGINEKKTYTLQDLEKILELAFSGKLKK